MVVAKGDLILGAASNLFAPDADELAALLFDSATPDYFRPLLPMPTNGFIPLEPDSDYLDRLIGSGTEIWKVKAYDVPWLRGW